MTEEEKEGEEKEYRYRLDETWMCGMKPYGEQLQT